MREWRERMVPSSRQDVVDGFRPGQTHVLQGSAHVVRLAVADQFSSFGTLDFLSFRRSRHRCSAFNIFILGFRREATPQNAAAVVRRDEDGICHCGHARLLVATKRVRSCGWRQLK